MFCKKCGKEIDDKAVICVHCGTPVKNKGAKKPIYKKWWFWVLIAVVALVIIGSSGGSEGTETPSGNNDSTQSSVSTPGTETPSDNKDSTQSSASTSGKEEKITYEKVDLKTMLDELDSNALKAEKTYQDKYVEVVGEINNFDSDGSYISIQPVNADDWSFETVMCNIKNEDQLNFLLEKKVGDAVTIKGQITSIGEVLGYTIKIAEVH